MGIDNIIGGVAVAAATVVFLSLHLSGGFDTRLYNCLDCSTNVLSSSKVVSFKLVVSCTQKPKMCPTTEMSPPHLKHQQGATKKRQLEAKTHNNICNKCLWNQFCSKYGR